jgi:PHD/YefM family antitoxin component YafN of YafNO toxin-antitoxin module
MSVSPVERDCAKGHHMKPISTTDVQTDLDAVLDLAQKERLVIMRHGKPSVVVIGVEQYDVEDWELATSGEFWRMMAEVKTRLASAPAGQAKRSGKAAPKAVREPNQGGQGKRRAKATGS